MTDPGDTPKGGNTEEEAEDELQRQAAAEAHQDPDDHAEGATPP